mmetsp:Transcript_24516/g.80217  ORF Transcript_24516/g.80217 Transcript_24516/m.80217 type:complete len:202 (+) Transcript_24516:36-641(+)
MYASATTTRSNTPRQAEPRGRKGATWLKGPVRCGCRRDAEAAHTRRGLKGTLLRGIHRGGRRHVRLLLGLVDQHLVGQRRLGAGLARRVVRQHDGDANAEHALPQSDVPHAHVDVLPLGLAGLDHVAVGELHRLGARAADLARDAALHALGTALHDKAHNAIARAADGEAADQLVAQRLALRHRAQPAVVHLLGVQLHGVL